MRGKHDGRGAASESKASTINDRREWYFFRNSRDGRALAREELEGLALSGQTCLSVRMDRHRNGKTRRQDVDSLGDGLFELRCREGNDHFRVIFFHWGPHLVALTCFYKNQRATPPKDLKRAKRRRTQWRQIFGDEPAT